MAVRSTPVDGNLRRIAPRRAVRCPSPSRVLTRRLCWAFWPRSPPPVGSSSSPPPSPRPTRTCRRLTGRAPTSTGSRTGATQRQGARRLHRRCLQAQQAITREQLARALVVLGSFQTSGAGDLAAPTCPRATPTTRTSRSPCTWGSCRSTRTAFTPRRSMPSWRPTPARCACCGLSTPRPTGPCSSAATGRSGNRTPSWKTGAPRYLPIEVAARYAGPALQPFRQERRPRGVSPRQADRSRRGGRHPV